MQQILKLSAIIILLTFSKSLIGQYTFKGILIDEEKAPLIAATVLALSPQDSTMASFAITDADGAFTISNLSAGEYILQITYIGYGTFERNIQTTENEKVFDLGTIQLSSDLNKLDEVIVKGEFIPITVTKDTVEYNADAFRVRPNANVEELLKQLPGVEVEQDGSITAQGEEVQSVTVDGKKFFGNDPKMATKNIPADAVKKVQIFDQKSDKAEFSGVNDGNETKTINLELKDDKKVGYFGNIEAGYGTDDRYKAKISYNKFGSTYQAAILATYNNLNEQGFSFNDYQNFIGGGGGFRRGFNSNGVVNWNGTGDGNTTSFTGGMNLSYTPSKKLELTTSYFLTHVDKIQTSSRLRDYNLNQRAFSENTFSDSEQETLGHNANMDLEWKPDSIQRIDLELSYRYNNFDNGLDNIIRNLNTDQSINLESDQIQTNNAINNDFSGDFEYNRRLGKPGRVLTFEGDYGIDITNDSTFLNQLSEEQRPVSNTVLILQDQISKNDASNYRILLNYKEPLKNRNFIDFSVSQTNYNSDVVKDFFDLSEEPMTFREFNETLSSIVSNGLLTQRAGVGYTIDKEKYTINLDAYYNRSNISGITNIGENVDNTYNFFLPSISFNLDDPNIRLRYRTSVNTPSINQLQSVIDNTNPTQLYIGNPDLKPEYRHNISLRYFYFDRFNLDNMWSSLNYTRTMDPIVTSQTFDEASRRISTPVNVASSDRINFNITYSTPVRPLKIKTTFRTGGGWSRSFNIVNDVEQKVNTITPRLGITLENLNNEFVSVRLSGNLNYSQNRYEINTTQDNDFLNQTYSANLLFNMPKGWVADLDYNAQIFSEEQFGSDNTFQLLNASVSKRLMNDRLTLKLSGFDILNQNQGINRNISETYVEEFVSNTIQRYYMFSFIYNLNEFTPNNNVRFFRS